MKEKFLQAYKHITRPGADELLKWLESSDFFIAPASTRFHLSRPGGLVEHSVHVYERLRGLYVEHKTVPDAPGVYHLSPEEEETIAICGLLHDVCKVGVYQQITKNQKTYDPEKVAAAQKWQVKHDGQGDFIWETVPGYTFEDKLPYGHGEKSVYLIERFVRLKPQEAVAVRWHMGGFDDSVKGGSFAISEAYDRYPLAVKLHLADLEATYLREHRG